MAYPDQTLNILQSIHSWIHERRRNRREFVDGTVLIRRRNSRGELITACLVDRSAGGFRARYSGSALVPGEEVLLMTPYADFRACVAWSKCFEERKESGFRTIERVPFV
jgi:hypothetical protein